MGEEERLARLCLCIKCGGALAASPGELTCTSCSAKWPVIHGIADFMEGMDEVERKKTEFVLERYDDLSFDDLRAEYEAKPPTCWDPSAQVPERLRQVWSDFESVADDRGYGNIVRCERALEDSHYPKEMLRGDIAIEVGAGIGPGLRALSERFTEVCALEPSMPAMLLAKKRCEAAGLEGIIFVRGVAEKLPFADGVFDLALADLVIEHFQEQARGVGEIARTLKPRGVMYGGTPNRYSLFAPEPHVLIRFVGFVPRKWADRYTRLVGRVEYTGTRNPGYLELRQWLRAAFKGGKVSVRIRIPAADGKWAKIVPIVKMVSRTPIVSPMVRLVAGAFEVLCVKQGDCPA